MIKGLIENLSCVLFIQTYNKTFHELYYLLKWSCKNATIHFSYFIQLNFDDVANYIFKKWNFQQSIILEVPIYI